MEPVRAQVLGAVEGPGALTYVFDMEVSPEGRLFASQPPLAEIAVFAADGSFERTIGRRGQGPGELQTPGAVRLMGDTLLVLDYSHGINLFSQEGEFFGRISFNLPTPPERGFPTRPIVLLADGTVACFSPLQTSLALSGVVTHQAWVRASRNGDLLDTLIVRPVEGEYYSAEVPGSRAASGPHPAAWHTIVAIPPDGSEFIAVDRSAAGTGEEEVVWVHRIALTGDTILSRGLRYVPVPLATAWIDSVSAELATRGAAARNMTEDRLTEILSDQIPWPNHHPPVSQVIPASDGSIWLRREMSSPDSVRWDLLDSGLQAVAHTYLPASSNVMRASRESIWAVELDHLDVPWIIRYEVQETD